MAGSKHERGDVGGDIGAIRPSAASLVQSRGERKKGSKSGKDVRRVESERRTTSAEAGEDYEAVVEVRGHDNYTPSHLRYFKKFLESTAVMSLHSCLLKVPSNWSGDLHQLVHHINTQLSSPTSSLLVALQNKNGSLGDSDAAGMPDSWSDGILDIIAVLGEGASSVVEAVQDKWTGHRFLHKTIITHEGLLKQLCVHVAIEQRGQADDGAVQGKEPGHHRGADLMEEGLHGREGCASVGRGMSSLAPAQAPSWGQQSRWWRK
ncbi:hypothetical protein F5148DRAFT_1151662 [Russula earlei]|uniref:Uncharacterized protein n=1 Tax=Russula earlei TaxID=71964 RepID=A0ACC0U0A1_9AGAM|nr:hypothetical protein F5148DRAFT_1151662 [Russula earlei]